MSRRVLATLAAVTLLLGVAACGDEGEGPVTTPPPPVDSGGASQEPSDGGGDEEETDEPTVAAPDVPAPDPADYPGMDEETPEGAEQATRYFVAVMFWGFQSGETETFASLYGPTCGVCEENATAIESLASAGEYWSKTTLEDGEISNDPPNDKFETIIGYSIFTSPHSEPDLDSHTRTDVPELQFSFGVGLNWQDGEWIVDGLALDIETA